MRWYVPHLVCQCWQSVGLSVSQFVCGGVVLLVACSRNSLTRPNAPVSNEAPLVKGSSLPTAGPIGPYWGAGTTPGATSPRDARYARSTPKSFEDARAPDRHDPQPGRQRRRSPCRLGRTRPALSLRDAPLAPRRSKGDPCRPPRSNQCRCRSRSSWRHLGRDVEGVHPHHISIGVSFSVPTGTCGMLVSFRE